jgi:hypothetical protein
MELDFPPLKGGVVPGLNDAGIETFEGDFARNVVRECGQNSLDAAVSHDQPVKLVITAVMLEKDKLPFLPQLVKVLLACADYWDSNDKARKFFRSAVTLTRAPHIHALKVSDFGTTGVDGTDDDISSRWFGLVKSRGVSNQKEADSGGAYGIGKEASPPVSGRIRARVVRKKQGRGKKGAGKGGDDVENPENGDGQTTGGRKQKAGEGEGDFDLPPKLPNLTARAFCESPKSDVYEVVLRSDGDYSGNVWIEALGDDGTAENIPLESAETATGKTLQVENTKVKDLQLTAEKTLRLRVKLRRPGKYSLRASLS